MNYADDFPDRGPLTYAVELESCSTCKGPCPVPYTCGVPIPEKKGAILFFTRLVALLKPESLSSTGEQP